MESRLLKEIFLEIFYYLGKSAEIPRDHRKKKNLKGIPEGNIGGILEQTQERISEETSNGNTNRGSSNGISRGSFAKPPKEISRRMPT